MINKKGFTLAEVLITLGIIGIVAAMTIPTLVANYQKTQYVTSLKKAYTTVQNGLKLLMAAEGASRIDETSLFNGAEITDADRNNKIDESIRKYFKVLKSCKQGDDSCRVTGYKYLDNRPSSNGGIKFEGDTYKFITTDGGLLELELPQSCDVDYSKQSALKQDCVLLNIDINGSRPPNVIGRDYYRFVVGHDALLFPSLSLPWSQYQETDEEYWQSNPTACGTFGSNIISGIVNGDGCAARIIEEGWQMNY